MRRIFNSFLVIFLLGLILGIGIAPRVDATDSANDTPEEETTNTSSTINACAQNFLAFISSLLDRMAFEDYWKDYFVRNRCQQDDIFTLDEELENLLEELSNEYEKSCASTEISELQNEIRLAKMEIYFIRHIVVVSERAGYKDDAAAIQAAAEAQSEAEKTDGTRMTTNTSDGVPIETTRILEEMKTKFIKEKEWVSSEEEMKELINGWVEQYDHRIPLYWDCSFSPWEEVGLKFKELADTMAEIKEFGSRAKELKAEKEEKEAREAALAAQGVKSGDEKDAPGGWQTVKNFFKKHIDIKIREIEPPKDEAKLAEEIDGAVTFESLSQAITAEQTRYQTEINSAELLGKYWGDYKVNTGNMTADLVGRIEELSNVITHSSTAAEYLPGLKKAAKEIHKKQGSGTP